MIRISRPILWLALASLAAGCRVGPQFAREVPLPLPERFVAESDTHGAATAAVVGLAAFADPVLDALVASALRDNRDLEVALARLAEAAALAGVVDAAALPSVAFGADRQWLYASRQAAGLAGAGVRAGLVPRQQDVHRVGLTASWEIDLFGAVAHRRDAAAARAEVAQANVHGVALRVAAEVAVAYVELRHTAERLQVAVAVEADLSRLHTLAEAALAAGLGACAEVDDARAAWQRAQAAPPQLRAAHIAAQNRVAVLIGAIPGSFHVPAATSPRLVPAAAPLDVPSSLLRRRPDLLAAEAEVAAATAAVGIATADCYPRLFVLGGGGFEAQALDRLGGRGALQGFGGPSLQLPLFQGGALQRAVDAAAAGRRAAIATFAQRILTALADVETAAAQQRSELQRRQSAHAAAAAANAAAEHAQALFASGLQAEPAAIRARLAAHSAADDRLLADRDASLAAIAVWKALGGDFVTAPHAAGLLRGP